MDAFHQLKFLCSTTRQKASNSSWPNFHKEESLDVTTKQTTLTYLRINPIWPKKVRLFSLFSIIVFLVHFKSWIVIPEEFLLVHLKFLGFSFFGVRSLLILKKNITSIHHNMFEWLWADFSKLFCCQRFGCLVTLSGPAVLVHLSVKCLKEKVCLNQLNGDISPWSL